MNPVCYNADNVKYGIRKHCGPNQGPLRRMAGLPLPKITQDGCDGSETQGFIANLRDGSAAGFKYFSCYGIKQVTVTTRGQGSGVIELLTAWDGKPVGEIPVTSSNETSAFIHLR